MKKLSRYFLFLAFGCLFFASCKKSMPSDVIRPTEMEEILYDYHLAQAVGNDFNGEERYKRDLLIQYVFEKHHVTKARFDSSMVWYTRNMEKLGDIYKRLEKRYEDANRNLATLYQSKKEQKIASGDTVSLWYERDMYLLTASDLTNKLSFDIKADTTFHQLDRFVWQMQVKKLSSQPLQLYAGLTVGYKNDSTSSVVRQMTDGGELLLSVKADTLPIAHVQGFVYRKDSLNGQLIPVVLSDITLTRYHASQAELEELETKRREQVVLKDSMGVDTAQMVRPVAPIKVDSAHKVQEFRRRNPNDLRRQQRRN